MSNIKTMFSDNLALHTYEPGNCTRYQVLCQTIPGDISSALGAGDKESTLISVLNMPSASFLLPSYAGCPTVGYVMEKTGLGEADAKALRELIEFFYFPTAEEESTYKAEEGFGPS